MNTISKFKYIIFALMTLFVVSCQNPMEDIYNELDDAKIPYKQDVAYTLLAADYSSISTAALKIAPNAVDSASAKAIKTNSYFSSDVQAQNFVPSILGTLYPALKEKSTAKITYNYSVGRPDYLNSYEASVRTLSTDDYKVVDQVVGMAKAFYPSFPASTNMNKVLKAAYPTAVANDVKLVYYSTMATDPVVGKTSIFTENFDATLGTFKAVSVSGTKAWAWSSYATDQFAKVSGYQEDNEDWLISPQIDLTGQTSVVLNVRHTAKFVNDKWDQITMVVSADFNGTDIASATWTTLPSGVKPTGADYVFVETGDISLAAFEGKKIYIAFKYLSTLANAATWEVDWVKVSATGLTSSSISKMGAFYKFVSGNWSILPGAYALGDDDYKSMGNPGPGQYNNFSTTVLADSYLPQFLKIKYPFVQKNSKMAIAYKYFASSKTTDKVDEYLFDGLVWAKPAVVVPKTDQFIQNGEKWVFDPTISFTLESADYAFIVDSVKKIDNGTTYIDKFGTSEFYFGASSYYNNFDLRLSNKTLYTIPGYSNLADDNARIALTWERVKEALVILLKKKYPTAQPKVSGIDLHFKLTINTYENDLSKKKYIYDYQCTKAAPELEFTLISGPTLVP